MLVKTIHKQYDGSCTFVSENSTLQFSFEMVDNTIQKRKLLSHPFFQLYSCGGLSQNIIQIFSLQFYHIVNYLPRFISAIHSNTNDWKIRQNLLDNIEDIEYGKENILELWFRFLESIGIEKESLRSIQMFPFTRIFLDTINDFCRNRSFVEGLSCLYTLQNQSSEFLEIKLNYLPKYYNINDKKSLKFFPVFKKEFFIDKSIIVNNITSENFSKVIFSADKTAYSFWKFLDGIMEHYGKRSLKYQ